MWKQRLKYGAATLAGQLGVWALLERARRATWTIVCYHRVLPADARAHYFAPSLVVTPESLAAHCAVYLKSFEVVTVAEGLKRVQRGAFGARPLLSLSFDDGYRDNVVHAAPILERFGLRGSFYVIAGLVDTHELPWYDQVARAILARGMAAVPPRFQSACAHLHNEAARACAVVEAMKLLAADEAQHLTREIAADNAVPPPQIDTDLIVNASQIKVLAERGHEIGAHSLTHPVLTRVAEEESLRAEIFGAKERLEALAGTKVETFCYPNGDFGARELAAVAQAGYAGALSTRQGLNRVGGNVLALKRVFIDEDWLRAPSGAPSAALLRAELALLHRFRN